MEAASQSLPIISTAVSAIPEFIETGLQGILTSDSATDLATAIMTLVQDPQKAADMADAAYNRLVADFGMDPGIAQLSHRLTAMGA
jgi:glycosyltransferase involved in cell wall biosynthesis